MNLHDNQSLFAAAVQFASRSKEDGGLGIKPIFIEKDYWICRSLKYLSDSEVSGKAVFKGGTSISEASDKEIFQIQKGFLFIPFNSRRLRRTDIHHSRTNSS